MPLPHAPGKPPAQNANPAHGVAQPEYTLGGPLNLPPASATEWLLTDGRGGFAMGAVSGVPARRYHALLIHATKPPVGRVALFNATVDQLIVHPGAPEALLIELSSFRFAGAGDRLHPDGASRISCYRKSAEVEWVYELPVARVTRTLHMHGADAGKTGVTLRYVVERLSNPASRAAAAPLRLSVRPLLSLRDMHGLIRRAWADNFGVSLSTGASGCRVDRNGFTLHLRADGGDFSSEQQWWHNFLYSEDAARGQDCIEDLFSPGAFTIALMPTQQRAELLIRASPEEQPAPTLTEIHGDSAKRAIRIARAASHASAAAPALPTALLPVLSTLVVAADEFVVTRAPSGTSIIAGYPWFSDWGRDTFISLPGLMLATGRFDDARATLLAFATHRKNGLIPNMFNDQTGEAEYNTADASLWFIHAACAFVDASGDRAAWREHLAPACLDIVAHHRKGTDFNIAMDPFDKLITAGTNATQLTWMDARRDGVVFTPRHGKAVEINALWIGALNRLAAAIAPDDPRHSANLNDLGNAASASFRRSFWNPDAGCLFDCLTPSDSERGQAAWIPDATIRPNQIFAVSLPHSPLTIEQQRAVVACVRQRLWTERGVRTLDPASTRYRGRYEGNLFQRDGAYHQGTAWPWLLGALTEAVLRVGGFSATAKKDALSLIRPILDGLAGGTDKRANLPGAFGHVAEIFDGDPPQRIQGCPAQAWSVAEILRVLVLVHSR